MHPCLAQSHSDWFANRSIKFSPLMLSYLSLRLDSRRNLMFSPLKKMFWLVSFGVIVFATVALVSAGTRKVAPRVEEQSLIAAHRTEKPLLTLGTLKSPERQTSEELRALTVGNDAIAPAEAQSNDEQVEVEVSTVRA